LAAVLGLDAVPFPRAERENRSACFGLGPGEPPVIGDLMPRPAPQTVRKPQTAERRARSVADIAIAPRGHAKAAHGAASTAVSIAAFELSAPHLDLAAATVFRQRRSAVDFDASLRFSGRVLHHARTVTAAGSTPPWNAWPWSPRVHLAVFVHRSRGSSRAVCVSARGDALRAAKARDAARLAVAQGRPAHLPLYFLWPHDSREAAKLICCHQDIAADSCYALGMLASFEGVEHSRGHRRLYWDAVWSGRRSTSRLKRRDPRHRHRCFFDDEMHRLLGLEGHEWQSLYHFTAGGRWRINV